MFKFNNNHIFTGYLKQLLSSFNLPKCRVYTEAQRNHHQKYLKNAENWVAEKTALIALRDGCSKEIEGVPVAYKGLTDLKQLLEIEISEIDKLLTNPTQNLEESYRTLLLEHKREYIAELDKITKELFDVDFQLSRLQPELDVLKTNYHSSYEQYPGSLTELPLKIDTAMRYIPYIKDGRLQVYTGDSWHDCHYSFNASHKQFHEHTKTPYAVVKYSYGQKILNYTKTLQIQNTIYDSYTHEYLGDYLRFHRDFANINLMPLYNCFSNRACPHLDLEFEVGKTYKAKFKTDQSFETSLYKYYMVPVKFFKNYTIAIDSAASVEVCCCLYDDYNYDKYSSYKNKNLDFEDIPKLTYQCFSDMQFKTPVLYSGLQKLNSKLLNLTPKLSTQEADLCQCEDDLKLILKIPVNNKSSIVILEGDYTRYNDSVAKPTYTEIKKIGPDGKETAEVIDVIYHSFLKETNKTIVNYENLKACEYLADKLITPLQLLRTNTGESYPFADRLIEYLIGNAITVNEDIKDNVVRAKTVMSYNCNPAVYPIIAEDGIWEPLLQCLVYDYINEQQNVNDINHDILGFIDKDVEKWYAAKSGTSVETIANVDIYKDQWRN